MKTKSLIIFMALSFLTTQLAFATIDTRLVYIENTLNSPSVGQGTLIIDVEARFNDGNSYQMNTFQDAFQLDETLRAQTDNSKVTFSDNLFPSPGYTTTQDFSASSGRIRYVFTYDSGPRVTIGTDWTRVFRITIQYTMTSGTSTVSWYDGIPNYEVTDSDNVKRIGSEQAIPPELTNFSVPVELAMFTAEAVVGAVELKWRTESETVNFGFHIYRSLEEKGEYAQINAEIIHGSGTSNQAHDYSYMDNTVQSGSNYYYKLADVDFNGRISLHGPIMVMIDALPTEYRLEQNFPNPFNPETSISFSLKETGKVTLKIYNLQGQLVRTLVDQEMPVGFYSVMWNGSTDQGTRVSSGTYLYTLKINGFEDTKKLVFMQ